jgi:hypothetical protein
MKKRIMVYLVLVVLFIFAGNSFAVEEEFFDLESLKGLSLEEIYERIDIQGVEGSSNTFYGVLKGSVLAGKYNSFFGGAAGYLNETGQDNTFVGYGAGMFNTTGNYNSYFGDGAGAFNETGSSNVFIGRSAGSTETGSNKLYIDNSSTTSPLIYGDFDSNLLRVNGTMESTLYRTQSETPGFWLDETGSGYKGAYFVLDDNWMQVQRRAQNFGAYEASPIFINIGAPGSSFYVNTTGYVGFGLAPSHPLHMVSGAHCTAGGVWTNASSRKYKTDIKQLTADKALTTLTELKPVEFVYKADKEEKHVGFISEDAPALVATKDRKGMSSMDVVAVLTKVVQEQQKTVQEQRLIIAELSRRLTLVEKGVGAK